MLYIKKGEEPEFLAKFKKKYPLKTYDSKEFEEFRIPLNFSLRKEQKGLCAYCCCRIEKMKAHNEHIEPRNPGTYASHRSLDYMNMIASCNNPRTCGIKKGNVYNEDKFISPLDKKCEDMFAYYSDGVIEGNDYTIDLLNLNDFELRNARKAVYKALQGLDKQTIEMIYLQEETDEYSPFFNVIKWYWKTL
jgi:uncharacterized protein (TIGR02646 family)